MVPARQDRMLIAVLDGHGEYGTHVAGRVSSIFEQMASGLLELPAHRLPAALVQVFAIAQAALQRDELARYSGTTAVLAIADVSAATVTTAHVGDSRLTILVPGSAPDSLEAVFETEDHLITNEEAELIKSKGGEVLPLRTSCGSTAGSGLYRMLLNPEYATEPLTASAVAPGPPQTFSPVEVTTSRSLGDLEAHARGITAAPTIHAGVPLREGMALVAASASMWAKFPKRPFLSLLSHSLGPPEAARQIVLEVRARCPAWGDAEDVTAVVVRPTSSARGDSNAEGDL